MDKQLDLIARTAKNALQLVLDALALSGRLENRIALPHSNRGKVTISISPHNKDGKRHLRLFLDGPEDNAYTRDELTTICDVLTSELQNGSYEAIFDPNILTLVVTPQQ